MFSSNSSQPGSRVRAQTPTRSSRLTASSPTPSRNTSRPNSSLSRPSAPIRPASSMSFRTPVRAGITASSSTTSTGARPSGTFSTPSRPASSLSSYRPSLPSFAPKQAEPQAYCGTVKVSVRPRPLPPQSNLHPYDWTLDADHNTIAATDLGEFQYDHVYDPLSNNHDVYTETVKPVVEKCMEGFNGTIFAYGMTGSGKTYSMQGSTYEAGIIQLAVNEIYERIEFDQDRKNYSVTLSYLEIYNEKLYDLLNPDTSIALKSSAFNSRVSSASTLKDDIKIRDDPIHGVNIVGLHQVVVNSPDQLLRNIAKGDSIRRTGGTDFNARSSRSHAIVMIKIKCHDLENGSEKLCTLSLCDLAGSEKATTQHERRKEGAYINKSLLALSTVISKLSSQALSNGSTHSYGQRQHIPYRDSKLTRLLQGSLSGSSVVSILCTIHLSTNAVPETINTLRFAARAKDIQITVKKNETVVSGADKDSLILKLKSELDKYKKEVKILHHEKSSSINPDGSLTKSRKTSRDSTSSSSSSSLVVSSIADSKLADDYNQLAAENSILMEQVEHYKRLNDYSRLNLTMVRNEHLQALSSLRLSKNYHDVPEIVAELDDFYKKQAIEFEEMSSYIAHLENKVKCLEAQNGAKKDHGPLESIIKDQKDEILELKEQLSSKDSIINALKNSNRLRASLDHGPTNNESSNGISSLSRKRSDESMRSSNDIYTDMNLSSEMNSSVVMTVDDTLSNALRPISGDKLNHVPLNSSPPGKTIEIEGAW